MVTNDCRKQTEMSLFKKRNIFLNPGAIVVANTLIAAIIVFVLAACASPVAEAPVVTEPALNGEDDDVTSLISEEEIDMTDVIKVEASVDWTVDQGWDAFYEPVLERYRLAYTQGRIDEEIAKAAGMSMHASGLFDGFRKKYALQKDTLGNESEFYYTIYGTDYSFDYAIFDIDDNGISELLIGMRDWYFYDIWTANDEYTPVFLFSIGTYSLRSGSIYKGDDMNYIKCFEGDWGWRWGSVYHIASDGISLIEDICFEGNDWGTRDVSKIGISKEEFNELFPGFSYYEPVYTIGDIRCRRKNSGI